MNAMSSPPRGTGDLDRPDDALAQQLQQAYDRVRSPLPPAERWVDGALAEVARRRRRTRWATGGAAGLVAAAAAAALVVTAGTPGEPAVVPASRPATAPASPTAAATGLSTTERTRIQGLQEYAFDTEFAPGRFGRLTLAARGKQGLGEVPAWGLDCQDGSAAGPVAASVQQVRTGPRELRASLSGYATGTGAEAFRQLIDNTGRCRWSGVRIPVVWAGADSATHRLWRLGPHRLGGPYGSGPGIGPGAALAAVRVGDVLVMAAGYAPTQSEAEAMATGAARATAEAQRRSGFGPTRGRPAPGTTPAPGAAAVPEASMPRAEQLPAGWRYPTTSTAFPGGAPAGSPCEVGTRETVSCPADGPGVPTTSRLALLDRATGSAGYGSVVINAFPSEQDAARAASAYTGPDGADLPRIPGAERRPWPGADSATSSLFAASEPRRAGRIEQAIALIRDGRFLISVHVQVTDSSQSAPALARQVAETTAANHGRQS